jgi:hypothetical protein
LPFAPRELFQRVEVTILDDDVPGLLGFGSPLFIVQESMEWAFVAIERRVGSSGVISAQFDTTSSAAHLNATGGAPHWDSTPGADYQAVVGRRIRFEHGVTRKTVRIRIYDDACAEVAEDLGLRLSKFERNSGKMPTTCSTTTGDCMGIFEAQSTLRIVDSEDSEASVATRLVIANGPGAVASAAFEIRTDGTPMDGFFVMTVVTSIGVRADSKRAHVNATANEIRDALLGVFPIARVDVTRVARDRGVTWIVVVIETKLRDAGAGGIDPFALSLEVRADGMLPVGSTVAVYRAPRSVAGSFASPTIATEPGRSPLNGRLRDVQVAGDLFWPHPRIEVRNSCDKLVSQNMSQRHVRAALLVPVSDACLARNTRKFSQTAAFQVNIVPLIALGTVRVTSGSRHAWCQHNIAHAVAHRRATGGAAVGAIVIGDGGTVAVVRASFGSRLLEVVSNPRSAILSSFEGRRVRLDGTRVLVARVVLNETTGIVVILLHKVWDGETLMNASLLGVPRTFEAESSRVFISNRVCATAGKVSVQVSQNNLSSLVFPGDAVEISGENDPTGRAFASTLRYTVSSVETSNRSFGVLKISPPFKGITGSHLSLWIARRNGSFALVLNDTWIGGEAAQDTVQPIYRHRNTANELRAVQEDEDAYLNGFLHARSYRDRKSVV